MIPFLGTLIGLTEDAKKMKKQRNQKDNELTQQQKDTIGLALQLEWEYPDWGDEHVTDMIRTYTDNGEKAPCSMDTLNDWAIKARRLHRQGLDYAAAEAQLLREISSNTKPTRPTPKRKARHRHVWGSDEICINCGADANA